MIWYTLAMFTVIGAIAVAIILCMGARQFWKDLHSGPVPWLGNRNYYGPSVSPHEGEQLNTCHRPEGK